MHPSTGLQMSGSLGCWDAASVINFGGDLYSTASSTSFSFLTTTNSPSINFSPQLHQLNNSNINPFVFNSGQNHQNYQKSLFDDLTPEFLFYQENCHLKDLLDSYDADLSSTSCMPHDLAVAEAERQLAQVVQEENLELPEGFDALLSDLIQTPNLSSEITSEPLLQLFDPENVQLHEILSEIDDFLSSSSDDSNSPQSPAVLVSDSFAPQKRPFEELEPSEDEDERPKTPPHKKESNKRAAIRYRSKKQKEKDELFEECADYARRNSELKSQIDEVQCEISLIKSLLVQALIAKNQSQAKN